jgi:hypothetical protein
MSQTITIDLVADVRKLQAGLATANTELSGLQKSVNGIQSVQTSLAGVGVAAASLAPALGFIKSSTEAASDMNETIAKTGEVFGTGTDEIVKFAESAAKNLGQSKQQALDAAANFGIFGRAANLSGSELASFSTDFTVLASDLASFNNTTPEEAVVALGAALRGESEPLRRFGVLLSADAVAAEAMALGIVESTVSTAQLEKAQVNAQKAQLKYAEAVKEYGENSIQAKDAAASLGVAEERLATVTKGKAEKLTAEQKILATQSLIYKQTSVAQGDFARTSDGLANSSRILAADQADLSAEIGEIFLPIMQDVVVIVREAISFFRGLPKPVQDIIIVVGLLAAVLGPIVLLFSSIITLVKSFTTVLGISTAATKLAAVATGAFNLVMSLNPIALVIIAIVALIAVIITLTGGWDNVIKAVQDAWKGIVEFGKNAGKAIGDFVVAALKNFGNFLKDVRNFVSSIVSFFLDIPNNMLNIGRNIVEGLWNGISGMVNWFRDKILGFFGNLMPQWVRDALGIKSPSKVFENIGKNIVQGTTNGLRVPALNTRSLGIAGGTGTNITINAGLGTDGYKLGREVNNAINRYGKVSIKPGARRVVKL